VLGAQDAPDDVEDLLLQFVDEARGLVLGSAVFNMPGPGGGGRARTSLLLYELFNVESGRIRAIEAVMGTVPLGTLGGWE
jgi:hypothetical protein